MAQWYVKDLSKLTECIGANLASLRSYYLLKAVSTGCQMAIVYTPKRIY